MIQPCWISGFVLTPLSSVSSFFRYFSLFLSLCLCPHSPIFIFLSSLSPSPYSLSPPPPPSLSLSPGISCLVQPQPSQWRRAGTQRGRFHVDAERRQGANRERRYENLPQASVNLDKKYGFVETDKNWGVQVVDRGFALLPVWWLLIDLRHRGKNTQPSYIVLVWCVDGDQNGCI